MQSSSVAPQAGVILDWLKQEMGYRLQTPFSSSEKALPSVEGLRRICRGNMLPVWKFLLERVRSEKTVEKIKRNILVHGNPSSSSQPKTAAKEWRKDRESASKEKETTKASARDRKRPEVHVKVRGRIVSVELGKPKDSLEGEREKTPDIDESKERTLREWEDAEIEVERLRHVVERLRKDLKGRMLELSREEGERQRVLDDNFNSRHKQVLLESSDERCEQAVRIFWEYQRRLHHYVDLARDAKRGKAEGADVAPDPLSARTDQDSVYATSINSDRPVDGLILIETAAERSVRKACELLASYLLEGIRKNFPAFDGGGNQRETLPDEMKLVVDVDGEMIPDDVRETALNLLKNPLQLLWVMAAYTSRIVAMIRRETERIDIRADAERLRYKYENNRITEDVPSDTPENSFLQNRGSGGGKFGTGIVSKGKFRQLRERQRAHVQQFLATEQALNQAAEARKASEELIKRIHGTATGGDVAVSMSGRDNFSHSGSSRQFELEVLAKERELAGLKASVASLTGEVQRLKKMCEERKAAEDDLRQKWKRIEEFDARRSELESLHAALIDANMAAATSWEQHTKMAKEHSANIIIPLCVAVREKATSARDLVEKEATTFLKSLHNRLYMFPASPQALLDSMGISVVAGPEAWTTAERNAELITSRAGAGDPSAVPSICRIAATSQHIAGYDGPDAGLAAVVESLRFCHRPYASPACLSEDLARAMSRVQTLRDLVGSGRLLLGAENSTNPDCKRGAMFCASTASEQEKVELEQWVPDLKAAVQEAQRCLEDCKRVRGLVDEWWEQPAATSVDWVTVDGQNVGTWLSHVKQLQTAFYDKQLL